MLTEIYYYDDDYYWRKFIIIMMIIIDGGSRHVSWPGPSDNYMAHVCIQVHVRKGRLTIYVNQMICCQEIWKVVSDNLPDPIRRDIMYA